MTTPQRPIHSGFGAGSTTADITASIDLSGRTAVVTGANSGLGLQTALALGRAGARIVVLDRDTANARNALAGVTAEFVTLDLSDPTSIDSAAEGIGPAVHILVESAGIMAAPFGRDARGNELQFSINYLGHFQLAARLWPALQAAGEARVVTLTSLGHRHSPVVFDDVNFETRAYDPWLGYGQSKTAMSLFAVELDRRGQTHGVRAFAAHPGSIVATGLKQYLTTAELAAAGMVNPDGSPILDPDKQLKTPEQGAATPVWCATSPQLTGLGGVYCENCDIAELAVTSESGVQDLSAFNDISGVMPYAVDPESAKRLWDLSEKLTGVSFL
ncbi:putative short-chain dehydrogenase/reductase [Actinoplanes missouriensis 431]|uniref:Putative short-chain dehydrogenase/reductase n=1 Tax=Actinoplanes missouriensis (strain ATCC 14538 / DSM 43046 / CBS 188.64 / JCM 3121 / NBRC 102363 / NCIMB 12654 / NRRL B-3342 / UNCC 431) TaxID=512565 RepID=I0H475_ACTM4|nr:SDR family NAD(P)-dependent oxidoreductase [Actinoplanes missouriensis]BAL87812.1 putative short-chain dehydrogenase/reductase [Actinoplanes missouriensis 431]